MFETGAEELAYDKGFAAGKPYWVAIDREELTEALIKDQIIRTLTVEQLEYLVAFIDNFPNEDVA